MKTPRLAPDARRSGMLLLCLVALFALGCGGGGGGKSLPTPLPNPNPGVNLTGVVDDGGPTTPVPGAVCLFRDDDGSTVGPVTADGSGRFTLRIPAGATGRLECTPPGMTDLILTARVAAGDTDLDIGDVDPLRTILTLILEVEIEDEEIDPEDVDDRSDELEDEEDLDLLAEALGIVVDALLETGLDAEIQEIIIDLYDNGQLDEPAFGPIAGAVNADIEDAVDLDDLTVLIDELHDYLFGDMPILTVSKLLIEHNATDEDTGFQGFADGDPWDRLEVSDPGGAGVLTISTMGGFAGFGLTEFFFETSEPPNDEVPIDDVLARLAEGDYGFTGDLVDGKRRTRFGVFSHDIPAGPVLVAPADEATGLAANGVVIDWNPVTTDIDGGALEIIGYQVIVEEDVEQEFPNGFARPVLSVYLPANVTRVTVPNGFLKADACYKYEVLAIEESGNQTLSGAAFETGDGCGADEEEEPEEEEPMLKVAKLLIEHNASDADTGFQGFADGDPWSSLTITDPDGVNIARFSPEGSLFDFGLAELFFETSEPENAEVPIDDVLARLPEGTYTFSGIMVDGGPSVVTAEFSHDIPAGPVLLTPADAAEDVDPANTVVSWRSVTTDVDGDPDIEIVGYQVIVELDAAPEFQKGFAKPVFSIYVPAGVNQIRVPAEFMESGEDYKYEVLAIEVSGNQTLAGAEFSTR